MLFDAALKLFLVILIIPTPTLFADCPHLCECKWKSGKESVICISANITSVPLQLDAGTQILDLSSNNGLTLIKHDEFSQAGLLNLQKIFLTKCKLKNLERFAFRNLNNLVELDLSYNQISLVPSYAFGSIPELRELKLSGNPIQRISNEAFVYIPQLVRLELSECKIGTLEPRAFKGLEKSLEWLKLDKNRLVDVTSTSLTILHNLHGLDLAGNPWNCSCALRPLREWMLKNNIPFGVPPVCQYPKRLESKPWDKLDLDEFACVPEIFAYETKTHGVEGKNVTMTCRITGIPTPNVRWMLRNKVIANLSGLSGLTSVESTGTSKNKKLYLVQRAQNNSSVLTILTADLQDAGVYICAAENKAGKAEASVTLAVSRKPPEGTLSNKVLLISVISGIFLALSSCLAMICLWTIRNNKFKRRWRRSECGRSSGEDTTYEKIELNNHLNRKSGGNGNNGNNYILHPSSNNGSSDILTSSERKNGEYRVVPCGGDTDHDEEDEDEDEEEDVTETSILKSGIKETVFLGPKKAANTEPLIEDLLQQEHEQNHFMRNKNNNNNNAAFETRDDLKRKRGSSTSGLYNKSSSSTSTYLPQASTSSYNLHNTQYPLPPPHHKKQQQHQTIDPKIGGALYTSELSSLSESCEESFLIQNQSHKQKYPDLLLENSLSLSSPRKSLLLSGGVLNKANSEGGGSIPDINEIFCTLPRKKSNYNSNSRYKSTDSQSPLLAESRYCSSSGGESYGSNSGSLRRLSSDSSQRVPAIIASKNKKSTSYLNLTFARSQTNSGPPSPIKETLSSMSSATPLLDFSSLENRVLAPTPTNTSCSSSSSTCNAANANASSSSNSNANVNNANTYDYHAAQLERFLEEYRSLQKQLTKMKETCDNLRQDSKSDKKKSPMSPNANQSLEDVIRFPSYESDLSRIMLAKKPLDNMFNK